MNAARTEPDHPGRASHTACPPRRSLVVCDERHRGQACDRVGFVGSRLANSRTPDPSQTYEPARRFRLIVATCATIHNVTHARIQASTITLKQRPRSE